MLQHFSAAGEFGVRRNNGRTMGNLRTNRRCLFYYVRDIAVCVLPNIEARAAGIPRPWPKQMRQRDPVDCPVDERGHGSCEVYLGFGLLSARSGAARREESFVGLRVSSTRLNGLGTVVVRVVDTEPPKWSLGA